MKTFLAFLAFAWVRLQALVNFQAWFLILLGLALFTLRTPMPELGWVNLPIAVSVLQTAGLIFMLCGFQIMISLLMWPNVNLPDLLERAEGGNLAAGTAVLGLFVFNGLSLVASVMWLSYAVGAQVGR